MKKIKSTLCAIGTAAILISSPMTASADDGEGDVQVSSGKVRTFATGIDRAYRIEGRANIVRLPSGFTVADLAVKGLAPNTSYGSHVHNKPCSVDNGGGHYQHEIGPDFVNDTNEIWLSFTSDDGGMGRSLATHDHFARRDAQSVVIHDTDGARIACADLPTEPEVTKGRVKTFAIGLEQGYDIRGKAIMVRNNGKTVARLFVKGLTPNTAYGSHVHNKACNVDNGGGHYQHEIGTGPDFVNDTNETWLSFTSNSRGMGRSAATHDHIARDDAQSVVIHDTVGARIACADLH